MDQSDLVAFIGHTEAMVSPRDVGRLHGRAEALARLPRRVQRAIVDRAGGDDPTIGFIVEPYAFFLSYEIVDLDAAAAQLPPHHRIVPSAMFTATTPRPCAILAAFNVHTSVFWGSRVELYVIAEDRRSGMLSWVICDYESNTINYDPGEGFSAATTERSLITTSHAGDVLLDVVSAERPNRVGGVAHVEGAPRAPLEQRLWIEGNLSVDYGGRLMDPDSVPFGLVFDPDEMRSALDVPLDAVDVETSGFGADYRSDEAFEAACFPYAQHFLTSSFPSATPLRDADGLHDAIGQVIAEDL